MGTITLNDIVGVLAIIVAICTPIATLYKFYKKTILDRFEYLYKRIAQCETDIKELKIDNEANKKESILIIKSVQACLKGLKEQGCNGPVTEAINNIDDYLLHASHLED